MLNSRNICTALRNAIAAIPSVVAAMNGDATRIKTFTFDYGAAFRAQEAIYKMEPPAILIVPIETKGVNRDASTMWLHKFDAYVRMANVAGQANPIGYHEILSYITSKPVPAPTGPNLPLLSYRLYKNPTNGEDGTECMDVPTFEHKVGEDAMDFFVIHFSLPELGDQVE